GGSHRAGPGWPHRRGLNFTSPLCILTRGGLAPGRAARVPPRSERGRFLPLSEHSAMSINAADVMKLRDRTGMQMMKCKEALTKANGDMEKAIELLRAENKNAVVKSAGRETTEGRIGIFIDQSTNTGGIIELRCESAPVAKNEMFVKLASELAQ